jgi:protein-S-isoprenylcysteine O-methyltransferase Ste14
LMDEGPRIRRRQLAAYMAIFVVAPVFTYVVGGWLDSALSLPRVPQFPWNLILGFLVFVPSLATGIKATRQLYARGLGLPWGEADRRVQSTRLVTEGIYAYTRNPMTLGYSLLPCGMGIMFRSPGMAMFVPTLVLLVNVSILKFVEEPNLEERFGEEYKAYKARTPFLVPRILPFIRHLLSASDS